MIRTVCTSCRRQRANPVLFVLDKMATCRCTACGHVYERRVAHPPMSLPYQAEIRLPTCARPMTLRY